MKINWALKTLGNQFLQELISTSKQTNPPPGYEKELKCILREKIFDCDGMIAELEGSVHGLNSIVKDIDMIVPSSPPECIEVKMYDFVQKVPKDIQKDFKKLNKIGRNYLSTFVYFGFYGHYQKPLTKIPFSSEGRINEIALQCKSMKDDLLQVIGQSPQLNDGYVDFTMQTNGYIYYSYWMSF